MTGTLDGQGRSVELSGKALDKNVIGVVRNLGVAGQATMGDCEGALAIICSGSVQNVLVDGRFGLWRMDRR